MGNYVKVWTKNIRDEFILLDKFRKVEKPDEEIIEKVEVEEPVKKPDYWAIAASGTGLFSDGYVNNSISAVNVCLKILYPEEMSKSSAISNVSSVVFAGTVLGQLGFGYVADKYSRKLVMLCSNSILIIFALLCGLSWGANASVGGMLAALTAYRFFLGIGIGGEYPAGSVAAAEASSSIPSGKRNRWFIWFTNCMIDSGFVIAALVPVILLNIYKRENLGWVWRMTLGFGAIPPLALFYLRLKFKEHDLIKNNNFRRTAPPYFLIFKYYGFRLAVVSLIWFIYNFSSYSFGIYSAPILSQVNPEGTKNLNKTFGYNVILNLFYLPGGILGAYAADYLGPRLTLTIGVIIQGILGFVMAAIYPNIVHNVGAFITLYGLFQAFGEFSCGDNIGLIASKTSSSAVRGQYYGIAAAVGKIGAFVGTYVFPYIQKSGGPEGSLGYIRNPFWVSSSLCIFTGFIALFFLPGLTQDAILIEDEQFKAYLEKHGFDTSLMEAEAETEEETQLMADTDDNIKKANTSGDFTTVSVTENDSGAESKSEK